MEVVTADDVQLLQKALIKFQSISILRYLAGYFKWVLLADYIL